MTCKECYPILNELDLLPIGEVQLCPRHAMLESLAEAVCQMRDQHAMILDHCRCQLCVVANAYDSIVEEEKES